jgi:anti-anti-sigma factor
MTDASINVHRRADGAVVTEVRGEIDVQRAAALRAALVDAATSWRPPYLIVDLLYVTLIDSTGIGALVAGHHAIAGVGGSFAVRNASDFIHHQLRVTGLADVLNAGRGSNPYAEPSASLNPGR